MNLKVKLCEAVIEFLEGPWLSMEQEAGFGVYEDQDKDFIFNQPASGQEIGMKKHAPALNQIWQEGVGLWEPPESQTVFILHTHREVEHPSASDLFVLQGEFEVNSRISSTERFWNPVAMVICSDKGRIWQVQLPPRFFRFDEGWIACLIGEALTSLYRRRYPSSDRDLNPFELIEIFREDPQNKERIELVGHEWPPFAAHPKTIRELLKGLGCKVQVSTIEQFLRKPEESLIVPDKISFYGGAPASYIY